MLSSAIPSLSTSKPNAILSDVLPDLRSLVLVDNTSNDSRFEASMAHMTCTVDYREVFMWHQSVAEDKYISGLSQSMTKDDVINLQFTRFSAIIIFCLEGRS
jgi:hypothetical protein